jgi:hypothetical protein
VLLSPGQFELEFGTAYRNMKEQTSLMQVGYFERYAKRSRMLSFSLTGRAGVVRGVETWLTVPWSYNQVKEVSTNEWVRSKQTWHTGDINFGGQFMLKDESANWPALSASLAVAAPTGSMRYYDIPAIWKTQLNNGSGHWSIMPGLSFVRTLDPVILFGGVSYQYSFADTIDGYRVQPGWGVMGYAGVGFALNEKFSLGARVEYDYYSQMKADGVKVQGSDMEPMNLAFSASYRIFDNWVLTPQVSFGLNDDAGTSAIQLRVSRRF